MPTYDFSCPKCDTTIEKYFGFNDEHVVDCSCGTPMKKIIAPTRAIFRGGGWGGS